MWNRFERDMILLSEKMEKESVPVRENTGRPSHEQLEAVKNNLAHYVSGHLEKIS